MTPAETLAKAKQLDRFLGRAVTDIKASDRTTMNKFAELAAKVKANREAMEAEADHLSEDADKTMSLFMASAGRYRTLLNDAKDGIKAMEEAALAMAGHNGGPLLDSPQDLQPSPPASEPPAAEPEPEPIPMMPSPMPAVEPVPAPVMDATATGNPPA